MATVSSIANLNTIIRWYNNMLSIAPELNNIFTRGSWSLCSPFDNIIVYHMVYSIPMPDLSSIPIKEDTIKIIVLNFNSLCEYTSKNPNFQIINGFFSLLINEKVLQIQIIPNHYKFINSDIVFIGKDVCCINCVKYYQYLEAKVQHTVDIKEDASVISSLYDNKLLQIKICKLFKIIISKTHDSLATNKQRLETALKFINFELCKMKNDEAGALKLFSLYEQTNPNFIIPRLIITPKYNNQKLIETQLEIIRTLDTSETQLLDGAYTLFQISQMKYVHKPIPTHKPIINNGPVYHDYEPSAKRVNNS